MSKPAIIEKLKNLGYSKEAQAAILANIDVETGGTFDHTTKQRGGKGYGLFQFDFMKKYYDEWLGSKEDSMDSQVDFMHEVVQGDQRHVIGAGNAKKLMNSLNSGSVKEATKGFMDIFEKPGKPHAERRYKSADDHFSVLDNTEEDAANIDNFFEERSPTNFGEAPPIPERKPDTTVFG